MAVNARRPHLGGLQLRHKRAKPVFALFFVALAEGETTGRDVDKADAKHARLGVLGHLPGRGGRRVVGCNGGRKAKALALPIATGAPKAGS